MTDNFARPNHTSKSDSGRKAGVRRFAIGVMVGLFLSSILFSAVSAAPDLQATATFIAPDIVISEFRTRGPGGGNDEFIELFNPTGGPVNISGWKIMGSNASGGTSARTTIPSNATTTNFLPGQHYLIVNSGAYSGSVTLDISYGTGIADNGGIALTLADETTIIDQVGLDVGSAYKEGTTLLPLSGSSNQSYERKPGSDYGSCYDTDDNTSDFQQLINISDPQNSSVVSDECSISLLYTPTPTLTLPPSSTASSTPTITSTLPPTSTGTETSTLTISPTGTPPTSTFTPTITHTPGGFKKIIINEVAWAGTDASTADEWIELYNPGPSQVDLTGWVLRITSSSGPPVSITFDSEILGLGYYLLENDENTTNVPSDQTDTSLSLSNSGNLLLLYDPLNRLIDTANFNQGAWPAGTAAPKCSMERASAIAVDNDFGWFTNNNIVRNGLDANGDPICGTPKNLNWSYLVTATPTLTPTITLTPTHTRTRTKTRTPTKTRTYTPAPLVVSSVVINEFLVKPRADYNQDGTVDSGDAFIEIKNLSTINVSVSGWYLDDQNGDSSPFYLPSLSMAPGARQVYYASETNIILSEAVDSVRLFKTGSSIGISDAYTYTGGVKVANQSWCRYTDGSPSWMFGCEPTPGEENKLPQAIIVNDQSELTLCLSTEIPSVVREAECTAPGLLVWSPIYWIAELQREYPLFIQRDDQYDLLE